MRGRRRGSSGTATDFLVCFPPRAHLALMPPKTACSPSRPSTSSERRHSTSGARPSSSSSRAAANRNPSRRHHAVDVGEDNEPSSPKVTCAGQIKVSRSAKPKGGPGGAGGGKKKATWMQALGIKKDALPFLNALHGAFRLNVSGCFGRFPGAVVEYTSGEEDEEEEEEQAGKETDRRHGDALAKWFMVLEEGKRAPRKNQEHELPHEEQEKEDAAPPANALMLMRCRSAPAKGLARRLGVADAGEDGEEAKGDSTKAREEETEKESLVVMRYPPDFFQVSMDIAKETWIVGGDDSVLRCRSWKK
ncbi:hypothetical protein ACQJBY_058103 [Aegilops geniculata]